MKNGNQLRLFRVLFVIFWVCISGLTAFYPVTCYLDKLEFGLPEITRMLFNLVLGVIVTVLYVNLVRSIKNREG